MWNATPADFDTVRRWGHIDDPFAAQKAFKELNLELRWLNAEHRAAHNKYIYDRLKYIEFSKNFDHYYKTAKKPIDETRWQYLMLRKAWYIMPLGWDKMAREGGRVIDAGCGDGDTTQRFVDFALNLWKREGITDKKLEVFGTDLNESRIENANAYVRSGDPRISVHFAAGDMIEDGVDAEDGYFDHALCTGVIEILEDGPAETFIKELCRVTRSTLYIEDLAEEYPGGLPRRHLAEMFTPYGFKTVDAVKVLSEPFGMDGLADPMKIWPIFMDLNLHLERS